MRDFFHNSAVYLLDTRFAVYDDVIEIFGQNADDVFKIRVDFAIATRAFGTSDCDKGISVPFYHCVEYAETRFVEKFDSRLGIAVFDIFDDAFSYVVYRGFHVDAERGGKPDRRVCVYCENTFIFEIFRENSHGGCRKRSFSHSAFACESYYGGFLHITAPFARKISSRHAQKTICL